MKVAMQHELYHGKNCVLFSYSELNNYSGNKPSFIIKTTHQLPNDSAVIEQCYTLSKEDVVYLKTIFDHVKVEEL